MEPNHPTNSPEAEANEPTVPPAQPQPAADSTQPAAQPEATSTSRPIGLAVASLVTGILGFINAIFGIGAFLGLAAIILGIIALAKKQAGKGMSIAGIILGAISLLIGGLIITLFIIGIASSLDRQASFKYQAEANMVAKKAENYNQARGVPKSDRYPTYQELTTTDIGEAKLMPETAELLHDGNEKTVSRDQPIAYDGCSFGAYVFYYDSGEINPGRLRVGNPSYC